ncbi:hypothetical protein BDB00DRAFT_934411, partial [Zychaea mexicana]|uniref:uncharacterized protein n=1 Tax=Zychaea mexicana TaxID=64656 RepID=UPI0022FEC567
CATTSRPPSIGTVPHPSRIKSPRATALLLGLLTCAIRTLSGASVILITRSTPEQQQQRQRHSPIYIPLLQNSLYYYISLLLYISSSFYHHIIFIFIQHILLSFSP